MAYHSEVLQKERDMLRKDRLSSPRNGAQAEKPQGERDGDSGVRRAGGGSHRFSVMAEAALAQVRKHRPLGQRLGNYALSVCECKVLPADVVSGGIVVRLPHVAVAMV